jgi:ketol-acid reductoisomerase
MREAISNTAELGATLGGQRIVDASVRHRMSEMLAEIRAGKLAHELRREQVDQYGRLEQARLEAAAHPVEQALRALRDAAS